MLHFLLQLQPAGLPQQAPAIPELPSGPSLDRVRGPIEIPFLETWQIVLIALLSIIAAGLIGWKLFRSIRKHKRSHMPVSPYDAAIAELGLAAERTVDDDERFAVLSSQALRRYFETSKGMDAPGKTTDEFLKRLNDHSLLCADAHKSLAECLQHCDRVKFARAPLTKAERRQFTESALKLIRQCETTLPETDPSKAQP